jgi:hypothetical protein
MRQLFVLFTTSMLASTAFADEIPGSEKLRMNQIQVIGSHNSYLAAPSDPLFSQVKAVYPDAAAWDYDHPPLDEQLDRGVRSFELDLYYDPEAIRVFHVPRFDMNSTCETLVDCATVLRDWSRAHPKHVPIVVLLELKIEDVPQANMPVLPFDAPALAQLERELLSVFEPGHLIRPDDVRGEAPDLKTAIETAGWPRLDEVRGRLLFVLHTTGKPGETYRKGNPSLAGRPLFLQAYGDDPPHAAVYVKNNPNDPEIAHLVGQGYIVRTRADANLKEAEENNTARRDQALASGAQIVTTDFFSGRAHVFTGYEVALEGGVAARVNPLYKQP